MASDGAPCATLRLPDGREVSLPVLTDAAGALFVDVRRLQPDTGVRSTRRSASARLSAPARFAIHLALATRRRRVHLRPGLQLHRVVRLSGARIMQLRVPPRRSRVPPAPQVTFIDGEKGELLCAPARCVRKLTPAR